MWRACAIQANVMVVACLKSFATRTFLALGLGCRCDEAIQSESVGDLVLSQMDANQKCSKSFGSYCAHEKPFETAEGFVRPRLPQAKAAGLMRAAPSVPPRRWRARGKRR